LIKKVNQIPLIGYALILFISVFLFAWWSNPNFEAHYSPDTWEYIKVGKDFSNPGNEIRPFLYPLIIRFCMMISQDYWEGILISSQMLLHSFTILILFNFYVRLKLPKQISFLLSLFIGINPNLLVYCSKVLPQQLLGVFITITVWFSFNLFRTWHEKNPLINYNLYATGIFSGLALVIKPSWMFGIIPVIIVLLIFREISKNGAIVIALLFIFHFSFNFVWGEYKESLNYEKLYGIESNIFEETLFWVQGQNINIAAIRMGLVDYAKDTPLYVRIRDKELLPIAREMTGSTDQKYKKLIKSFTWEEMNDVEFAKAILKNAPIKLLVGQLRTWPTFFTKRMFHPNGGFPGLPQFFKYLYIGSFNKIYYPGLLILLMLFFCLIYKRDIRFVVVLNGLILIYFSLLHAVFTPSPEHFIYYRTSVEYILFFTAFLPIGILFNRIKLYKR
jgi:hypothetical protein